MVWPFSPGSNQSSNYNIHPNNRKLTTTAITPASPHIPSKGSTTSNSRPPGCKIRLIPVAFDGWDVIWPCFESPPYR
eukprot:4725702-Ditylum_brightwellii.AAC.1